MLPRHIPRALTTLAAAACAWVLTATATPAMAAATDTVVGYVRDLTTQRYLYTEVHELTQAPDGRVLSALSRYLDPQGREVARKTLDYRLHRTVPRYRMDIPAQGYAEGILGEAPDVTVFKSVKGKEERRTVPMAPAPVAADSGFNQLIQDLWPQISAGETVRFGLIVAGRTARYSFRARRVDDVTALGVAATRVRVEPDSVLRLVVDPIVLTYDTAGTRLLVYEGVSNILDPDTGKVYPKVRITYGGPAPAEARLPRP